MRQVLFVRYSRDSIGQVPLNSNLTYTIHDFLNVFYTSVRMIINGFKQHLHGSSFSSVKLGNCQTRTNLSLEPKSL